MCFQKSHHAKCYVVVSRFSTSIFVLYVTLRYINETKKKINMQNCHMKEPENGTDFKNQDHEKFGVHQREFNPNRTSDG